MRVATFFSGIGSPEKALERLGIDFELVHYCEIDKYAVESYKAIHNPKVDNLGDIRKVDYTKLNDFDLLVAGFPCQDISLAGKQQGLKEGSNTRSSLVWTTLEIIEYKKPKYIILENVKNLNSEQFEEDRKKLYKKLEDNNYICYSQVMNAKDYGIPQNRERLFIVGIRSDIDKGFIFPTPQPLKLRLKDMLEDEVDEKYYLSDKMLESFTDMKDRNGFVRGEKFNPINPGEKDYGNAIKTTEGTRVTDNFIKIVGEVTPNSQAGKVYDSKGISPTICAGTHGYAMGYIESDKTLCLNSKVNGKQPSTQDRVYDTNGVSTAITTSYMPSISNNLRIRKLTPLECFRLMGFDDEDFYKAQKVCSNTQLYKQAGNSIVVNVMEALLKSLLDDTPRSIFAFEF